MPVNSEQREQFYLESGQLRLRNIYAKWQVSVTPVYYKHLRAHESERVIA